MIFPLLRQWVSPLIPASFGSSKTGKAYKSPSSGFVSIGGGGGAISSRKGQGLHSAQLATANENESEEHIVKGKEDVQLQYVNTSGGSQYIPNAIVVSREVSVTTEDFASGRRVDPVQRV